MNKLVLLVPLTFCVVFLLPGQSEARSIHPELEARQLEHQITLLERKISDMTSRLEDLREQLCLLQENCGDPEPEGTVLITEVLFDPGPTDVQGTDLDNEWIEVFNGTNGEIDLNGWSIGDGSATDVLATDELILGSGKHLIITRSASTDTFWTYGAGTLVIHLQTTIGNSGLRNAGEAVILYDANQNEIDAVSWGDDTRAFTPPVATDSLLEGQSIARISKAIDTDTVTDWQILETPTPGS